MRNKRLIILLSVVVALVVIVVACGATFLVRNVEAYNYYGYDESLADYDGMVLEAAGIEKNSSMFFLDEQAIKERVENAYYNIGVINVERKFPDRVSVNYVVYERMFNYNINGMYYHCYSSCRIGSSGSDKPSDEFSVIPKGKPSTTLGAYFEDGNGYDRKIISSLVNVLHGKGLMDRDISGRIDFVDLSRDGYVYIRMRSGCSIEILGSADNFELLLARGWSVYADTKSEIEISKMTGLIRLNMISGGSNIRCTYQKPGTENYESDNSYYYDNYVNRS